MEIGFPIQIDSGSNMHESTTAQIILAIVPLVGIVAGSILLFFFLLWRYRIQREIIKSGHYEPQFWKNIRSWSLLIGTVATALGLPMTIFFIIIDGVSYASFGGLIPFSVGLGFLLFFFLMQKNEL